MKNRILAIILMSIMTLSGISTAEVFVFADESADYSQIDGSGMQETESNILSDEADAFQIGEPADISGQITNVSELTDSQAEVPVPQAEVPEPQAEVPDSQMNESTGPDETPEQVSQQDQKVECLVQFDLCGYGIEVEPVFVMPGGRVQRPEDPTAEGLLFAGWFREPEYITEWNFEFDVVTEDTMLFAKWLSAVESAEESELQVDPSQNSPLPESTDDEVLSAPESEIEKEADIQTDY